MRRRPAGFGVRDFLVDVIVDALAQRQRRHRHALEFGGLGIAGDKIEDARDVPRDDRIAGEERQVGIDARRHRMIIAGADMHVGRKRGALAAHHQRQLGVGLQLDEAEHDLHAGAFKVARPADIGLLVEARLEFDQRGDGFAGFGGLGQRPDDRGVGRGAVERLLDRDDVGIARRLLQEIHHHVERFIRVVDDEILLPDRREAIAAMIADAVGIARRIGHEFEIGPVEAGDLPHLVERQHAVDAEHAVVGDAERALHEAPQFGRHRRLDVEPDHRSAAAPLERGLEQPHQIFGFFEDFDFGVADDAERADPFHRIAGKQLADEKAGGAPRPRSAAPRRLRRSAAGGRNVRCGSACGSARSSPCRPWRARAASAIEKPRLGMNGNGCAGSTASGVSSGKTWREEIVFEPGLLRPW